MTLVSMLYRYFIEDGLLALIILSMEAHIFKKHIPKFPNELIPFILTLSGIFLVTFTLPFIHEHMDVGSRVIMGIIFGFATTGAHQFWKQGKYFAKRMYYLNPKNDRRNNKGRDNLNIK